MTEKADHKVTRRGFITSGIAVGSAISAQSAQFKEDFVLSRKNFTSIRLPNEGGFYMDDRAELELPEFRRMVCMQDCKGTVEITMPIANEGN